MIQFRKILVVLLCFVFSSIVLAAYPSSEDQDEGGIHIGNGGNVVQCPTKDGMSYKLLDYFESGTSSDLQPYLGLDNQTVHEKVQTAIDRLKFLDPQMHVKLSQYLESFMSEVDFLTDQKLGGISDTGLTHIPRDCKLLQAAVQMPKFDPLKKKNFHYTVDLKIWEKLDNTNKAGLILHEIVYRNFFANSKHNTSFYVRSFVRLLSGKHFIKYTLKDYIELLKNLYIKNYSYNGVSINIEAPVRLTENLITHAKISTPQSFEVLGNTLTTYSQVKHHFNKEGFIGLVSLIPEYGAEREIKFWKFKNEHNRVSLLAKLRGVIFSQQTISRFLLSADGSSITINSRNFRLVPKSAIVFNKDSSLPSHFSVFDSNKKKTISLVNNRYKICHKPNKCTPL